MNNSFKSSQQIRQEFLEFFKQKGHTIVPSSSLIPTNDQTLLFTNAGMNQFKDIFLGNGTRPFTRATDTQKVMRVSGKHNDFDDVGRDTYHHTFFEMLGSWSFGDYYKKEAIIWAWELLTEVWNIPKERLYASVYNTDTESLEIWQNYTNIDHSHILTFGNKENFWEMGNIGPCGPCSEIHIDLTPDLSKSIGAKGINADNPLFIELWNLVFIQYNRQEDGSLIELPAKHVDTGMGFERITAVLQNVLSNYDTDLFIPMIKHLEKDSGVAYNSGSEGTPHRVIADHIRALTFAIGDGIIPSNEGRGYVIRKILRRAVRFGRELGYTSPFLYKIVSIVVDIMKDSFPEINEKRFSIESVIQSEEESFFRTLNKGFDKIKTLINQAKSTNSTIISGEDVFILYDSMGFPVDFTEQILKDENLAFEYKAFDKLMQEQKEKARASWKGEGINFSTISGIPATKYLDITSGKANSTIISIIQNNTNISFCSEGDSIAIVLDQSPFYGEKGGQIGDSGIIKKDEENIIEIFDTKIFEEKYIHLGKVIKGSFNQNDTVQTIVDIERKKDIARNHSTAHLLFKALRTVLGNHISQAGSWVGKNKTRIDFTHPKAISYEELQKITKLVNQDILENHKTQIQEMPIDQAKSIGAIATFEEKYGNIVRVVTIGDSIELCGGTHIDSSGEIGTMIIINESSVSAGTRRIEAIVGKTALDFINDTLVTEQQITEKLKCSSSEILDKIDKILEESKQKDKDLKILNDLLAKDIFTNLITNSQEVNSYKIIINTVNYNQIQNITDIFKKSSISGILVLGSIKNTESVIIQVSVSKDLINIIKASDIIKEIAPIIDGKGGGKPDQAVSGGKNSNNLSKALNKALEIITKTITTKLN